jgi:hypothetical protein
MTQPDQDRFLRERKDAREFGQNGPQFRAGKIWPLLRNASITPIGSVSNIGPTAKLPQYGNTTKGVLTFHGDNRWVWVMKVIFILASLLALAPMVRADEVVVRHEPTVVVHEHHHYVHHYHHTQQDVVVVHHN